MAPPGPRITPGGLPPLCGDSGEPDNGGGTTVGAGLCLRGAFAAQISLATVDSWAIGGPFWVRCLSAYG